MQVIFNILSKINNINKLYRTLKVLLKRDKWGKLGINKKKSVYDNCMWNYLMWKGREFFLDGERVGGLARQSVGWQGGVTSSKSSYIKTISSHASRQNHRTTPYDHTYHPTHLTDRLLYAPRAELSLPSRLNSFLR